MYNVCYSCRIHMWSITDILLSVHVYTHVRTCITYVIVVEYTCGLLLIYNHSALVAWWLKSWPVIRFEPN